MESFCRRVATFFKSEGGATAAEYAVMLALIIVGCLMALKALGAGANKTFTTAGGALGAGS